MPIFGVPLALIGLAALPALTAIYWLRTRFRRQEVSSLFLWSLVAQAHGGGRRATRLQTPLLWLLELLALLLLALAAAGPLIPRADRVVPVMIVLDDSYSMTSVRADGQTFRQSGVDAVRQELSRLGPFVARFVVAGSEPALHEGSVTRLSQIDSAVEDWRCESASSAIGPAVALAREVGGPDCRVLVISDHTWADDPMPADEDTPGDSQETATPTTDTAQLTGRLRWRAVGESSHNAGIVNAVRSTDPQRDDVLIEVANFSDKPHKVDLTLSVATNPIGASEADRKVEDAIGPARVIDQRTLDLAALETRRLRLTPPAKDEILIAQIEDDSLMADNRIVLLPPAREPLRVGMSLKDPVLSKAVRSAVLATGVAEIRTDRTELVFTDRIQTAPAITSGAPASPTLNESAPGVDAAPARSTAPWRVEFETPDAAEVDAYLGPFVIDYTHPLAAGLSLTGLVWSAPHAQASLPTPGRAIVSAGDVLLISERDVASDGKALRIRLRADRSTLLSSAAWPVLIANTIDWRRAELPGLSRVNARPGMPVRLNLKTPIDHVSVTYYSLDGTPSDEPANRIEMRDNTAVLSAVRPGVYHVAAGDEIHAYTVNALSPEESDISHAVSSENGLWNDERALRTDYRGLGWILGLAALALLALHAWLQYRPSGPTPAVISEATT